MFLNNVNVIFFFFYRALKTKHDTPKYGLIYHASLVGQTAPKNKGKVIDVYVYPAKHSLLLYECLKFSLVKFWPKENEERSKGHEGSEGRHTKKYILFSMSSLICHISSHSLLAETSLEFEHKRLFT